MTFTCTLGNCGFHIRDEAPDFMIILKMHERWHTNCRVEKRNNTEGEVTWLVED